MRLCLLGESGGLHRRTRARLCAAAPRAAAPPPRARALMMVVCGTPLFLALLVLIWIGSQAL